MDYSGFAHAFGGEFASRLRLMELPGCALTQPKSTKCTHGTFVDAVNDPVKGTLTANVTAAADSTTEARGTDPAKSATPASDAAMTEASLYVLTSTGSSDAGDYRASTLNQASSWDVSDGSGAFTYSVPITLPKPPMGKSPDLALTYNSQSVDGQTSASNNQASWVGMGWDLNIGFIEREYKNCTKDGLSTIPDMCWDSPNSDVESSGAVYKINLNGVTSQLIQDNTGSGAYHVQDDPGWRVQRLTHDANDWSKDYWVISDQDGARYYFGWGQAQNSGTATNATLRVPVVGNDTGEPCHDQFPKPCAQTWRWGLDRVVDANEVETAYFYEKEKNNYRSVAGTDQALEYDAGAYLTKIEYGWSSQIPGAKVPAKVEFTHVNRCAERMSEKDPLDNAVPDCPSVDSSPSSYPDVPVDLICDGTAADNDCRDIEGKTYSPTFFLRGMLWDIETFVQSDTSSTGWERVRQYQMKHALTDPKGLIDGTLWLDYIQQRGYGSPDITLPTINFNGVDLDNQVGTSLLNFRRVTKVFEDTGSTVSVTYGHATDADGTIDRQCDASNLPSQSDNHYECFWQQWVPDGTTTQKTGWFKKFVVTQLVEDPGVVGDGDPAKTTTYNYDGAPGWRFTNDPLVDDSDESWTDWRGYPKVEVTTGVGENLHSTYTWLYQGLDGDRTSKSDKTQIRHVSVTDSEGQTSVDSAWLTGRPLEESTRDDKGDSRQRVWHHYWMHNTAQYKGLPDARFVREDETDTFDKLSTSTSDRSTWREHKVVTAYDEQEAASTTFGLPMRIDDQGEPGVSDNKCTEFGRAYNTDTLDSTGTQRWMVVQDEVRHYTVSCAQQAQDQTDGQPSRNQDRYTTTFYDGATSLAGNKPSDGNPTEVRTYTADGQYRAERKDFDPAGRVVHAWDGKNNQTTTAYNPNTSWPVNGVVVTGPDPDGNGPVTAMSTTTYYSRFFGNAWKTVDANGNTTYVIDDAAGRIAKVFKPTEAANYPNGTPTLSFSYVIPVASSETGVPDVATGYPAKVTTQTMQSAGVTVPSVDYVDGFGRTRETQRPAPSGTGSILTVKRYDSSGNVAGTADSLYTLNPVGANMVNPTVDSMWSYNDLVADWSGRTILSQTLSMNVVQPQSKTVTAYPGAERTTTTPPTGNPTETYTDVYGQTAKVVEHHGASDYVTSYEYTRSGQLKYVHDSVGNDTHYTYNWAGDRLTATDPDSGTSTTTYDKNGNPENTTDANNATVTIQYDNLNRPVKTLQGSTVLNEHTYDTAPSGKGQLASATSYKNGKAYSTAIGGYDARGRVTGKTVTVPADGTGLDGAYAFTYGYDLADHITRLEYPAAGGLPKETVTQTYTAQGLPAKLTSSLRTYVDSTGFDSYGRLVSRSYGLTGATGTSATRTYSYSDTDGSGWLKNITASTATGGTTTKVQDDSYSRNNSGEVTALRENQAGQQQCYSYDDLDRLTDAWTQAASTCPSTPASDFAGPNPYQTSYSYDQIGNLQAVRNTTTSGATTRDYHYPGYSANESTYTPNTPRPHAVTSVTTPNGTDSYAYDNAGQLKARTVGGTTTNLSWDPLHHINTITNSVGSPLAGYAYDADGNILERTSNSENVLYLEGQELHKASGDTAPKATRYYSAAGTTVAVRTADGTTSGAVTWLLDDTQASSQIMIDASKGTVSRRRYTPFGAQRSANLPAGMDRGFLGKPEDDTTGLSVLGPRLYDATLARFLTPDPLSTPYNPQTISAYSYAANNPISYSDPTGLGLDCGVNSRDGAGCPHHGSHQATGPGGGRGAPGGTGYSNGYNTDIHPRSRPPWAHTPPGGLDVVWAQTYVLFDKAITDYTTSWNYHAATREDEKTYSMALYDAEMQTVQHQFQQMLGGSITTEVGADLGIPFIGKGSAKLSIQVNGSLTWMNSKTHTNTTAKTTTETMTIKKGQSYGASPTGILHGYKTVYVHRDGTRTVQKWTAFQVTAWSLVTYKKQPRHIID
jgi:RHS repeat-associated protein